MPECQPTQRKHLCITCNSRFSRLSHLQRHQLLHSDKPQETFQCGICDKSFNRKDVYLRHHRGVHGSAQATRRTRRKKSCERCIRYKLKCSRELPCQTCKNRNVLCKFDVVSPPRPQDQQELSTTGGDDSTDCTQQLTHQEFRDEVGIDSLLNAAQLSQHERTSDSPIDIVMGAADDQGDFAQSQNDTWAAHGHNFANPLLTSNFYQGSGEINHNEAFDLTDFGLLFDGSTFQASRTDWLGAAADYSDRQTLGSAHLPSESPYELDPRPLHEDGSIGSIATPAASLRGNNTNSDTAAHKDGGSDWPHALDKGGNESWPFDYTSNKGYRKIKLPPLRQVLQQTVGHRPVIDRATLLDLIGIFGSPYIPVRPANPLLYILADVLGTK